MSSRKRYFWDITITFQKDYTEKKIYLLFNQRFINGSESE